MASNPPPVADPPPLCAFCKSPLLPGAVACAACGRLQPPPPVPPRPPGPPLSKQPVVALLAIFIVSPFAGFIGMLIGDTFIDIQRYGLGGGTAPHNSILPTAFGVLCAIGVLTIGAVWIFWRPKDFQ